MASETGSTISIAAIVLAAGGSVRMGQAKQMLPLGEKPLVRHVTEAVGALNLAQVVVVVGAEGSAVGQALNGLAVEVVVNHYWADGLSTSVRAGVRSLRPEIQAALLVLADQPGLTSVLMRAVVGRYLAGRSPIVAPVFRGQRGNPVLFDRALFPELLAMRGDQGGRQVINRYPQLLELVEVDDQAVILDIDTPEDYERWRTGAHDDE